MLQVGKSQDRYLGIMGIRRISLSAIFKGLHVHECWWGGSFYKEGLNV